MADEGWGPPVDAAEPTPPPTDGGWGEPVDVPPPHTAPSPDILDAASGVTSGQESAGRYNNVTTTRNRYGQPQSALGKYGIMDFNVGPWSEEILGQRLSTQDFLNNPEAQDAIYRGKMGQYIQQYGPEGAGRAWLGGPGGVNHPERTDAFGTSVGRYGQRFATGLANAIGPSQANAAEGGWGPPVQVADNTQATTQNDSGWGPPVEKPPISGPMPNVLSALEQGVQHGVGQVGQTITAFSSTAPVSTPDTSAAAAPMQMSDILQPWGKLAPKVAYRLGESSPALGLGVAGGLAGAATPVPGGAIVGGTIGSAAGAVLQSIGPSFAARLKETPNDPNGAWDRAIEDASISGAFSAASWAAFPLKAPFLQGPIKQLAFQAFGVQPGISMAEQAVQNVRAGKPATEGLMTAAEEGAVMTAVPALGHAIVTGGFGEPRTDTPKTPEDMQADILDRQQKATQLEQDLQAPHVGPEDAMTMQRQADDLRRSAAVDQQKLDAPQLIKEKIAQADFLDKQAEAEQNPQNKAELKQRAAAIREDADFDGFLANMPPPAKERGAVSKAFINNIAPEMFSEKALQIDPLFARFKSILAQAKDAIIARGENYYYKWNKVPDEDVLSFLKNFEENKPLPSDLTNKYPWMQERAQAYRDMLEKAYTNEKAAGSVADFRDNYFPHLWQDPVAARKYFQNLNIPQGAGNRWFQKGRYYDTIEQGMNNGLTLKTMNPEELVTSRLLSGADMVARNDLLQELHRNGVAVPVTKAPSHILTPDRGDPNPWQQVAGPNGKLWMIAPDAQSLWENAVIAKGLYANEGLIGTGFNKWMALKNAWVPIKLGLSLFHPVHVAHISLANNLSRALNETFGRGEQSMLRRGVAIPEAIAQTVGDLALAFPFKIPFTNIGTPHLGKDIRSAWTTPKEDQTPQQQVYTQMMNEAGVSAQLSEQMRISAKRDFANAIDNGQYLKALAPGLRRALEKVSSPIFEKWIPNLKAAAVAREAEALFRRRPDLIDDDKNRLVAMRAIGKQVDNRFGEMFYGGLFWNRTLKDASIGSFLSLGWNLGFVREFAGGALEPAVRRLMGAPTPTRQLIRDVTSKSTNAFVYTMTAMTINAMITKSMTGDNPDGMDYIFPRIGGLNPDGSPRRISNPFYTREVPMAEKNIEERQGVISGLAQMMYHKMMFAPVAEMATNRNYFGYQIYDENAPGYQQAYQFGKNLLNEQLNPIAIAGSKRALALSGKPHTAMDVLKNITDPDAYLPLLGFGPAPAYASKSPIENRIGYLYGRFIAPEEKPFRESENAQERTEARTAYIGAIQRKDPEAIRFYARQLADLGVSNKTISKIQPGGGIQYMFQRLGTVPSAQINLLKQMSPQEFKSYYPKASKKTKADPEVQELAQRYYRG